MKKLLIVLALAVPALQVQAQEQEVPAAEAAPAATVPAHGDESRAWLDLQAGGNAASPTPASLPGEVADRVYGRYLKSFEYPIPEHLDREKFANQ
ncbi:DUF3613 domain-containing protein [Solimonas sp. SE-A11]|uniref:DUF3613 domain-containing protein n=1 Tax=Solimonas sp. SE-A11 TaxID=3054954 RepID=UPI00259D1450|nr:DUF3613 domain-containing protein [Solimonas sp. SE-A11]MDM4772433.1 DUF3613 domain-containing protein [Solimonas sp. SE-A11]